MKGKTMTENLVTVCNYCGGKFVDPTEIAKYCPDCVAAHAARLFRTCETAGHCEICDTDNRMSNYLVTITDYDTGETFDEYIITNPDALIDLIGTPIVGKVTIT